MERRLPGESADSCRWAFEAEPTTEQYLGCYMTPEQYALVPAEVSREQQIAAKKRVDVQAEGPIQQGPPQGVELQDLIAPGPPGYFCPEIHHRTVIGRFADTDEMDQQASETIERIEKQFEEEEIHHIFVENKFPYNIVHKILRGQRTNFVLATLYA